MLLHSSLSSSHIGRGGGRGGGGLGEAGGGGGLGLACGGRTVHLSTTKRGKASKHDVWHSSKPWPPQPLVVALVEPVASTTLLHHRPVSSSHATTHCASNSPGVA